MRNLRSGAVSRVPAEVTAAAERRAHSPVVEPQRALRGLRGETRGNAGSVYVYDLQTGDLERVADGGGARLSADGRWVAFVSSSSGLVKGDTNGVADVFVAPARPLR